LLVWAGLLGGVALLPREPLPPWRDLVPVAVYGVLFLGAYSVTLNTAERHVDAGTAAMIVNTGPILIAILAGVFLGEGYPRGLLAGCVVAFAGCVLIALGTGGSGERATIGLVLCAVAAVGYASAVLVQKAALRRVSAFQVTWLGCAAASVACLPFAPALARELPDAGAGAVAWTVYLGLMPTALGFVTWSYALRRTSAGS